MSTVRGWALRISNPWVSIALLTLVFVHQAVGSAGFMLRQAFELNEMAWFNGPLSIALWVALCVCLVTASLVRIPWRWSRAGAHLTHAGVLSLTVTTIIYFAGKIEGEALLLRHFIEVRSAGGSTRLLPDPGSSGALGDGTAVVEAIMPTWTIRSGEHGDGASQQVWAVMVKVTFKDAQPFTATVLEGHPELTQYTIEGRTPTSWLAEFTGVVAKDGRIHAVDAQGQAILDTAMTVGAKSAADGCSLEVTGITEDWPLLAEGVKGRKGTLVAWTLRGPSGMESGSSIVGEPTLTRFQKARVKKVPDPRLHGIQLVPAPTAIAYRVDRPALWVRSGRDSAAAAPMRSGGTPLPIRGLPRYYDHGTHVGGKPIAIDLGTLDGVQYAVTGFAPYASLERVMRENPAAPAQPTLDLVVTSESSNQKFGVPVPRTSDPAAIEDMPFLWLQADDAASQAAIHERLVKRFPPVEQERQTVSDDEAIKMRLVFMQGADRNFTLWVGEVGRTLVSHPLSIGKEITLHWANDRIRIRLRQVVERPVTVAEPAPVPLDERKSRSSVGDFMSFIQVTATTAGDPAGISTWVPYTPFPHLPVIRPDGNGTLASFVPRPMPLDIPGGPSVELEFSREPFALPGDLWMTGFNVPRRPGSHDPSEFFCEVAHANRDGSGAPETGAIHMNHPLPWGDWFLFQAQWDPPYQALSILGVGNRPAGAWMLAAGILLSIGLAWSGITAATRRSGP